MPTPKPKKRRPSVRPHHIEQAAAEAHACPDPFAWIDVECRPIERFRAIEPLARRIHALRDNGAIRLEDVDLERPGRASLPALLVFRVGDDAAEAYIGCAVADGRRRGELELALNRTEAGRGLTAEPAPQLPRGRLVLEVRS